MLSIEKKMKKVFVVIGLPADKNLDFDLVESLLDSDGRKIICGGSTANLFSRVMNKELTLIQEGIISNIPPKSHIDGIDMVTEGIVTLSMANKILSDIDASICKNDTKSLETLSCLYDTNISRNNVIGSNQESIYQNAGKNPAEELVVEFLAADQITFFVGTAKNQEYLNKSSPLYSLDKQKIIGELVNKLEKMGKKVQLNLI